MKILITAFIALTSLSVEAALLKKIKGTVTVNSVKISKEKKVAAGDEITALGKESSVQIFFEDGSRSLLRNGTLSITEEMPQEKTLISLAKGILFTSKAKGKTNLEIKTKNAAMGVRGTKFYIEETSNDTYLCVCEGVVAIKNSKVTTLVNKDEDVHTSDNASLKKSPASDGMLKMAWDGFNEMGMKQ